MSRPVAAASSSFPQWVALASLALVCWLFFGNALPAVRERDELRALAAELVRLRRDYDAAIDEAGLGRGANAHRDLQALLVAIDQQGYTPAELCAAFPPRRQRAELAPLDDAIPAAEQAPPNASESDASGAPAGATER